MMKAQFALLGMIIFIVEIAAMAAPSIRKVAIGARHSCVLFDNGRVKCFGSGRDGRLGYGDLLNRGAHAAELGDALPYLDLGDEKAIDIVAGNASSCVLLQSGTVKCWGRNTSGELGLGHEEIIGDEVEDMGEALAKVDLGSDRVVQIVSSSAGFRCVRTDEGRVRCWGANFLGYLGIGSDETMGDEPGELGDNLPYIDFGGGRKAIDIDAGSEHACALLDDQSLRCWGRGDGGQLGSGEGKHRGLEPGELVNLPEVVLGDGLRPGDFALGSLYTVVQVGPDRIKSFGINSYGQLGLGDRRGRGRELGELGDDLPFVDLEKNLPIRQLACGYEHCCALFVNRAMKCWGSNGHGRLGIEERRGPRGDEPSDMGENLPFVDLGPLAAVDEIFVGAEHSCALLGDRQTLKCWGNNRAGQLGIGSQRGRIGNELGEMGVNLPDVCLFGDCRYLIGRSSRRP